MPLFLLCVLLPVKFHAGPLLLSNLRVLLLVLVVPLGIGLLTGRYGRVRVVDVAVLAHLAWMALALAVRSPESAVSQVGSAGVEFVGGYLVGRAFVRTPEQFTRLIAILAASLVAMLPFVLYELKTGTSPPLLVLNALPGVMSEKMIWMPPRLNLHRVQMGFPHPIHFGLFAISCFALVFVGLGDRMRAGRRLALTGVVVVSTFASLSSGALLPMVVQIGLIAWAFGMRAVPHKWLILFGIFAFCYVVIDILSNRTPLEVFMSYATFSSHNAHFRSVIFDWGIRNVFGSAVHDIPAAPLFGLGMAKWIRPDWMTASSVDNYWLLMAMRYGVMGFLTIAAGYAWALWRIGTRDLGDDERLNRLRFAWTVTFFALALTLSTVHVWSATFSYVFFLFGAGMWLLDAEPGTGSRAAADRAADGADGAEEGPAAGRAGAARRAPGYSRFAAREAPPSRNELAPREGAAAEAPLSRGAPPQDGPGASPFRRSPAQNPSRLRR